MPRAPVASAVLMVTGLLFLQPAQTAPSDGSRRDSSSYDRRGLPQACETPEIVALTRAAFRGATAPGIAEDQFRLAAAIEQAAERCPIGKEDGFREACGWYATAGGKKHAEAAYRAARCERQSSDSPHAGWAFLNIAASNGHAAAQARLAIRHLQGVGVERNISYGIQLLVRSALLQLGANQPPVPVNAPTR